MRTDNSWLKPLEIGMKIKTLSYGDAYGGQIQTIVEVVEDLKAKMGGKVKLKLEKKVGGRRYHTARFWWVYERCELVK